MGSALAYIDQYINIIGPLIVIVPLAVLSFIILTFKLEYPRKPPETTDFNYDASLPEPPRTVRPKLFLILWIIAGTFSFLVLSVAVGLLVAISSGAGGADFPLGLLVFLILGTPIAVIFFMRRIRNHLFLSKYGGFVWAEMVSVVTRMRYPIDGDKGIIFGEGEYVYKFKIGDDVYANSFEFDSVVSTRTPLSNVLVLYDPVDPKLNWPYELLAFRIKGRSIPSWITPEYFFTLRPIFQEVYVQEHLKKFEEVSRKQASEINDETR